MLMKVKIGADAGAASYRPREPASGLDPGDTSDFENELRTMNVRPHVARRLVGSAIDRRTTRHPGYGTSQRIRKRIEDVKSL